MNKLITEDQAQAIVNYLAKRPYAEVFNLMSMLVSLPDEKPKDKKMPKFDVMTTHMYSMHWEVDAVSKDSAAEKIYENMKWEKEQGEWTNEKVNYF